MPIDKTVFMTGFKEDCETLISRFEQADDIRFGTFCDIWKDMKFSLIFTGRQLYIELLEFCEEALHICKQFMLMPPRFKEKIAGLYLLYGVYHKMPVDKFKIRIKLQDWLTIVELHKEIKTGEHLDANYILCKLVKDNAMHFCMYDREYTLERNLLVEDKQQFNPFSLFPSIKDLTDKNQILTTLDELSKEYDRKKKALIAKGESKKSLSLYKADTAERIINEIRTFDEDRKKQQVSGESVKIEQLPSTSQGKSRKYIYPKGLKRCVTFRDTHKIDLDSDEDSENL